MGELTVIEIRSKIYTIRGVQVMLDSELAEIYQVTLSAFNQAVQRNLERFPSDFMFQLTREELTNLKSQFVISSEQSIDNTVLFSEHGGARKLPYVFTEQGVYMLAGIIRSEFAIKTNIAIIRTFTNLRRSVMALTGMADEIRQLKNMVNLHVETTNGKIKKQDKRILEIAQVLDFLVATPPKQKNKIGFVTTDTKGK